MKLKLFINYLLLSIVIVISRYCHADGKRFDNIFCSNLKIIVMV